jgi:hypothetical protein
MIDIGITISFLISGLFGAILMVSNSAQGNLKSTMLSIIGGMASANYLTPVMIEMLGLKEAKLQNGLAFIIGFLGLKLVEVLSNKFLKQISPPEPAIKEPVRRKPIAKKLAAKKPVIKKPEAKK